MANQISDETEKRFKEFTDRLLNAEQYASTDRDIFTPGRLQAILQEFCEIIAEHVNAQSCTVQLKIYDHEEEHGHGTERGKELCNSIFSDEFFGTRSEPPDTRAEIRTEMTAIRMKNWFGTLAFPYQLYPKHAVKLLASNTAGPWYPYVGSESVTPLTSGLTASINQDRTAKLRDPLDIRATRKMRKLGSFDDHVWSGPGPTSIFYNYYGVPIRIHARGEAIGILKVENKGLFSPECLIRVPDLMPEATKPSSLFADNCDPKSPQHEVFSRLSDAAQQKVIENNLNGPAIAQLVSELNYMAHCFEIPETGDFKGISNAGIQNDAKLIRRNVTNLFKRLGVPVPGRFDDDQQLTCCREGRCSDRRRLYEIWNSDDIIKQVLQSPPASIPTHGSTGRVTRSLFNLAFLQADLNTAKDRWLQLEYPAVRVRRMSAVQREQPVTLEQLHRLYVADSYQTLRPKDNERLPVQILFKKLEDEQGFLQNVLQCQKPSEGAAFVEVCEFYGGLIGKIPHQISPEAYPEEGEDPLPTVGRILQQALRGALALCLKKNNAPENYTLNLEVCSKEKPRFCYHLKAKPKDDHSREYNAYLLCLPTIDEMKIPGAAVHWGYEADRWRALLNLNAWYCGREMDAGAEKATVTFAGELSSLSEGGTTYEELVDFITERLAARRQALAFATDLPNFDVPDAMKLSWAAVEIGKLIERQISYRGNHLEPSVPLTAIEFSRLPISSLSFVDDLRSQYLEAEGIRDHLEYNLRNEILHLGFVHSVNLTARIKPFRSYFERLGERHPRLENATVILWLYLLARLLERKKERAAEGSISAQSQEPRAGKFREFLAHLNKLTIALTGLWAAQNALSSSPQDKTPMQILDKFFVERIWGDLSFRSPLFETDTSDVQKKLKFARDALRANLREDKYLSDSDKYEGECERLLFRNYDPYVRSAMSLLIQLENRISAFENPGSDEDFCGFYEACGKVKEWLSDPDAKLQELEGNSLKELDQCMGELRTFLLSYQTDEFMALLGVASGFSSFSEREGRFLSLFLNARGLYKRARMILNVHWHQRPPKELGWDLGKLDYVGARLDCLFRNQVFAAYESIWERGDPFFRSWYREPNRKGFIIRGFDPTRRQRMLGLRTAVHKDGVYHATQITGLMDPLAVEPRHWRLSVYNLSKLSFFLGAAFSYFDPTQAGKYMELTFHRQAFGAGYVRWFKLASNLLAKKDIKEDISPADRKKSRWFGTYLLESVVDYLIVVIDALVGEGDGRLRLKPQPSMSNQDLYGRLGAHLEELLQFMEAAHDYSTAFEKSWVGLRTEELKTKVDTAVSKAGHLYKLVKDLDGDAIVFIDTSWQRAQRKHLDDECAEFGVLPAPSISTAQSKKEDGDANQLMPLVFVNSRDYKKIKERIFLLQNRLALEGGEISVWLILLRETLVLFQRAQSQFLLHGLSNEYPRSRKEILNRILNYSLLFRNNNLKDYIEEFGRVADQFEDRTEPGANQYDSEVIRRFAGWTAYDLFHYIRSLVPVEVQVRTKLASTMAEQYHNTVYKARPPKATAAQKQRMEDIGHELDELDKEMDVVVEDYINHWLDESGQL